MLALLPVGGYLATYQRMSGFELEYLVLTMLSVFGFLLLLCCVNRPLVELLPIWVLLSVFVVAYFGKFYWIVLVPDVAKDFWFSDLSWLVKSPNLLIRAYATITLGFVTFCLAACMLVAYVPRWPGKQRDGRCNYRSVGKLLVGVSPILMVSTAYVMYVTGVAVMGAEPVNLPFYLAGIIFYTRTAVIPGLLLTLMWCARGMRRTKYFVLALSMLFVHAVSEIVLRGTKGGLIFALAAVVVFWLLTNSLNKVRIALAAIVLLFSLWLWPVVSLYRDVRLSSLREPLWGSLMQVISEVWADPVLPAQLAGIGVKSFIIRLTGVNLLLPITSGVTTPMGVGRFFDPEVEKVVRVDIMGYSPEIPQGISPGLLGWFYVVGGNIFVATGTLGFTMLAQLVWSALGRSRMAVLPVVQSLVMVNIIGMAVDGVFDAVNVSRGIMVTAGSVLMCEWVVRSIGGARRSNRLVRLGRGGGES